MMVSILEYEVSEMPKEGYISLKSSTAVLYQWLRKAVVKSLKNKEERLRSLFYLCLACRDFF